MPSNFYIFINKKGLIINIQINNLIITIQTILQINIFKRNFAYIFYIKDLREIKRILNIRVTYNRHKRTLYLDQLIYINKIMSKLHIEKDTYKSIITLINDYNALILLTDQEERINIHIY